MDCLYKKIRAFLDRNQVLPEEADADPYSSALRLWERVQDSVYTPDELGRFRSTLTEPQLKSWTILDQWWSAQYHYDKPSVDAETVDFIKAAAEAQDEHVEDQDRRGYHVALAYLFVAEMVWYQEIKQLDMIPILRLPDRAQQILYQIADKVNLARQHALKQATLQSIAHASFAKATHTQSVNAEKASLGSTLKACPWLGLEGAQTLRRPAYLWDREAQKSVKTCNIPGKFPAFYCISHTWGRWRGESISLEGVSWPVPTNTRFQVLLLPEVFHRLNWPVRYIWFDLFCIPQFECPEQAEEIGKQAEIFRQAACNVLWMHDVAEWRMLEKSIMWLGLNYLYRVNPTMSGLYERLEGLANELNENHGNTDADESLNPWAPVQESEKVPQDVIEFHKKNPGSWWFSSLWTLQEAYLCPSSLLADRNWDLLGVGQSLLLTLDNLATLAYSPASDVVKPMERPRAVEIMLFTMKRWELTDLCSASRMSLLIAAESRQSTGPRAEAIMAALGAIDWFENYRKQYGRAPPQKDLVFDMYPLDFLQEARKKIGSPFFLHYRIPQNTIQDAEAGEPLGTMLPLAFNTKDWQVTQAVTFSTNGWQDSMCDSWTIQLDGSVIVKEAAVLNVGIDGPRPLAEGPVSISSSQGYRRFDSFHAWESNLVRVPHRLAVAVTRYNHRQFGVVLEGVESKSGEAGLVLVKTALFMTQDRWCQQKHVISQSVNWRIL